MFRVDNSLNYTTSLQHNWYNIILYNYIQLVGKHMYIQKYHYLNLNAIFFVTVHQLLTFIEYAH